MCSISLFRCTQDGSRSSHASAWKRDSITRVERTYAASLPRAPHLGSLVQIRRSEQSQLAGTRDRVRARGDVELAKDALHVRFDGVERDVERLTDLSLCEIGRK